MFSPYPVAMLSRSILVPNRTPSIIPSHLLEIGDTILETVDVPRQPQKYICPNRKRYQPHPVQSVFSC